MPKLRWGALGLRHLVTIALLFNLPFACLAVHRRAFDTAVHVFFADHYRRGWWEVWDDRWYAGFSTASYPPLAHQAVALVSRPVQAMDRLVLRTGELSDGERRYLAEDTAFAIVLMIALCVLPIAARELGRVFVGRRAATVAGLSIIFVPGIALSAWSFGQLPTICALVLILLAGARGYRFVRMGDRRAAFESAAWLAAASATHHGSLLLLPWLGMAIVWRSIAQPGMRSEEARGRVMVRSSMWVALCCTTVCVVGWPFIGWWLHHPLQTAIDHASRHNLLLDGSARSWFFWPIYGPLLLLVAGLMGSSIRGRRFRPLAAAFLVLFTLGLGGTTRVPWLLFGASADWLTYDRFALWAAALLTPFIGAVTLRAARCRQGVSAWWLRPFAAAMAVAALLSGWSPLYRVMQPAPLDMTELARFLSKPKHAPYRYLTLGFGEQLAKLAVLVENGSIDGNYHTGRELAALRDSGIGSLDGAVWSPLGAAAISPYLVLAAKLGTRWALVAHSAYRNPLIAGGWRMYGSASGVEIWENGLARPTRPRQASRNAALALWLGLVPICSLLCAIALSLCPSGRRT